MNNSILTADDFNIGDLVQCRSDENVPIFGQVIDVKIATNEIEIFQTFVKDHGILSWLPQTMLQSVQCVQMQVPVNCNFHTDSAKKQVRALAHAWKHLNIIQLDEEMLWIHGVSLGNDTEYPIIDDAQADIIREIWGAELDSKFDEFCTSVEMSGDGRDEDAYDSDDSFIDNSDDVTFNRARGNSDFVRDMHESVRFMNASRGQDETKRQREARAYLNHLHSRAAHGSL